MLPCLLSYPLPAPPLSYLSYTHLIPPCCPVCCRILFQPHLCHLSLLHTSYSSMLPCLLSYPLSAPPLSSLSYTHLIPPCCPVCCIILFQPHLCHLSLTHILFLHAALFVVSSFSPTSVISSLTHILFLHAALFVVLSSFSPTSVISLLHTSYSSMLPCLLSYPLSAPPLSSLSYTHLIPPCCPVCCILFQPPLSSSLTHILFLHAALFVVVSSFSPTSYHYTHLIPPCCPVCCRILFQPHLCHLSITHILFLHAALFVVVSSFSPTSVISLLHTSYSSMLPCLLSYPLSAPPLSSLSYTHLIPPCSPVCCRILFQPHLCHLSLTHILFLHAALFVVVSSFSPTSVISLLHTSYSSMQPCLLSYPLSAQLCLISLTHIFPHRLAALFFFSILAVMIIASWIQYG